MATCTSTGCFPEGSGFNPDVRNGDRLEGKVARVASIIFPQPLVIEKLNKLYQRQSWMSVQGIPPENGSEPRVC